MDWTSGSQVVEATVQEAEESWTSGSEVVEATVAVAGGDAVQPSFVKSSADNGDVVVEWGAFGAVPEASGSLAVIVDLGGAAEQPSPHIPPPADGGDPSMVEKIVSSDLIADYPVVQRFNADILDEAAPRSLVLGVPVTASYDANGLLTAATTPVGTIGDIQRDAQGLIESYDLNGTTYSVTRDGDGRVTEVAAS